MSNTITAPEPLPPKFDRPAVFVAGSIDDGATENWQKKLTAALVCEDIVVLNPRRENWAASVKQDAAEPAFREQVEWELHALERADIVAMYLAPESRAPISLMELGLWARSGKLIVACPDGFWRQGNVAVVCARYGVPLVGDLEQLINAIRSKLAQPTSPVQSLHAGRFLRLVKDGHWEYADRTNATGAAIILAVTEEQKLLLVEQYRVPVHARTIELPAGIIGDEPGSNNEEHTEAARRELIEETGYEASHIEALMHGPSSSGLTSETVTMFHATKLRRVGPGGGVAHEDITVHEVPLNTVHEWLEAKSKAGMLVDPKVYAGLYFISKGK